MDQRTSAEALAADVAATSPDAARAVHKPSLLTKLAYGLGMVAYAVKDHGLKYFLLIFYAQVVGLDPRFVSTALLIALIADAFSDPIVGYWSDNLRSKWGRRHPFMYAVAVPVTVAYYFLWVPPHGWGQEALFVYLLAMTVVIRTLITFYETPAAALAAEITSDYDERATLMGWRAFFGWSGGNVLTIISFTVIFPAMATATIPNGQFNPESYRIYAMMACAVMFFAIMFSALGTHGEISHFPEAPPRRQLTLGAIFGEIFETLKTRSFAALFIASLLGFIASGFGASLTFYISTYFWGFTPTEIGILTSGVFISAAIGSPLAPVISRKWGKKRGAIFIGLLAFIGSPLPIVLRLAGLMPENGDPLLFPIIFAAITIDVALIICYQVLAGSMIADLVEDAEVRTHRRSEGLFFSAATFMRKWGEGFGIVLAGFVLAAIGLGAGAQQGEVSDDTIFLLGAVYVPVVLSLFLAVMACISFYQITREGHEENLRTLGSRSSGS
ncbi:sugar transporter [Pacificimonas flava]|uniref:Sugar transporter n=2 Tax=Pacificimonas TaxID=1960290 RepID=A0A219B7W9_9SPHN|nr:MULTISPECIES: MFS transporter [Pacificimonas]MBZ6379826.1 MFS transporter [Pacificimonas aurantium]OWV34361.1 sugar transporter [Pacificimonas flava]